MASRAEHYFEFGPFRLDMLQRQLLRNNEVVPLTPKMFETLSVLVRNSGRLVSKEDLMRQVWPDRFVEEVNLSFNVSGIRRALGESARDRRYIETAAKRGYRFVADLKEVSETPPIRSIAVLPFGDLSPKANMAWLADGFTDSLISELAQIASLRVISKTSTMQYRRAGKPLCAFARALQAELAVEGSVLADGDRLRVNVRVIDAVDDRCLWAQDFNLNAHQYPALQSQLPRVIADAVHVKLTSNEAARLARSSTVQSDAHAAYLRGRYFWHQFFSEGALKKAMLHFQQAIELDPSCAPAWCGLADCYSVLAVHSVMPPVEAAGRAESAARKALELDNLLAEAHTSVAAVNVFYRWDWLAAERGIRRALELSPSYSVAQSLLTNLLVALGREEEAISSALRALYVDPLSALTNTDLAWVYLLTRRYDKALEQCRQTLAMELNFPLAHIYLGQVYLCVERFDDAITEFEQLLAPDGKKPAWCLAFIGYACGMSGRRARARQLLCTVQDLSKEFYVSPYDLAVIHTGLRQTDQAFAYLEKAYADRSPRVTRLNVEPWFDSLRADSRFRSLVRRLKVGE